MSELANLRSLVDVVAEYDLKIGQIEETITAFNLAGETLKSAACIGGTWGETQIDIGGVYEQTIKASLLKSAWRHVYNGLNIARIATAADKKRFEQAMAKPAPFTLQNITATFGTYVSDPWGNILRGLAEVFCDLDPSYKSHDKVKIGVQGLPKRIILSNVGSYGSWGKDRLENVLNALASYQGKPLVTWAELDAILKKEDALLNDWKHKYGDKEKEFPGRGVRLRRFSNGNGHLFFEPQTLKDINRALAEYYGEVLADCSEERPATAHPSTEVSKDLQYYPTPIDVVKDIVSDLGNIEGLSILEPSCGCGRFLDVLRDAKAEVYGIEYDASRAQISRSKGHSVLTANFLETVPTPTFDRVVMNPPFYGKHYAKHIEHALKFLKPGGRLTSILPSTARYDHGLVDGRWSDLPVGSFRESGTNINTSVLTVFA